MAAGKHGGYRSNEFKDRESVLAFDRRDYYGSKQEYHRYYGNGVDSHVREREIERKERYKREERYERDVYKSRVKETRSREDRRSNGYHSSLVVNGSREVYDRKKDREPGELSSGSGSDGAMSFELRFKDKEVSKIDSEVKLPPAKKQKVSPVGSDEKEKKQQHQLKEKELKVELGRVYDPQPSPYVATGLFGLVLGEAEGQEKIDKEMGQLEEGEELVPIWKASRWADEEEGEVSNTEEVSKTRHKRSVSRKVASSPEIGELTRGGHRSKSSEFDEGRKSGSGGEYSLSELDKNNDMEVDREHSNGSDVARCSDDFERENDSCGTPEPSTSPRRSVNMLQECRSVHSFERLNKINEGTYGVVYKAKDKKTGEIVALKKVKMEKEREGFPLTALREMNILLCSHHPSIVDVKEVVMGKELDEVYMVMEYMDHDLKGVLETMNHQFSLSEVKCLMLQLVEGVKYLHDNWIMHRDLKTSNLLFNNQGELKICDFGLSRQFGIPSRPYTPLVVTLWYRAPELLLGAKEYSTAIDMWSLGCIMAELLAKEPLFSGKTELDQLDKIFRTLGTPSETIWPGFLELPGAKFNFVKQRHSVLRKKFSPTLSFLGAPSLTDTGFDLLSKLLTYDPKKRITADEAVNHEWFRELPLPRSKDSMPKFSPQHARDRQLCRVMKCPDALEDGQCKELQRKGKSSNG